MGESGTSASPSSRIWKPAVPPPGIGDVQPRASNLGRIAWIALQLLKAPHREPRVPVTDSYACQHTSGASVLAANGRPSSLLRCFSRGLRVFCRFQFGPQCLHFFGDRSFTMVRFSKLLSELLCLAVRARAHQRRHTEYHRHSSKHALPRWPHQLQTHSGAHGHTAFPEWQQTRLLETERDVRRQLRQIEGTAARFERLESSLVALRVCSAALRVAMG